MRTKFYLILAVVMIATSCSKENEPLSNVYTPKNSKQVARENMATDIVQIQEFSEKNTEIIIKYSSELKKMDVPTAITFLQSKGAVDLNSYKEILLRTAADQKEFNYYNNLETNLEVRKISNQEFAEQVIKIQEKDNQMTARVAAVDWCRVTYVLEVAAIIAVDAGTAGTATPAAMIAIGFAAAQYTACVVQRDYPSLSL
jgi:hypothetical protein